MMTKANFIDRMARCVRLVGVPLGLVIGLIGMASASGNVDMAAASEQFKKSCGTCHTTDASAPPRQGPNLSQVIGRPSASLPDFEYSTALRDLKIIWSPETLDQWITNAAKMAPGTTMFYRQRNADRRALIIAYLVKSAEEKLN